MSSSEISSRALGAALAAMASASSSEGEDPPALSLADTRRLAAETGSALCDVEIAALERNILPERYRRNLGTVGWDGQIGLLRSTVVVVGAGGLGGWIIELLARMGVGHIRIIDGDHFQENNLNRQLGCTESNLGMLKADVLAARVGAINGAVEAEPRADWLTEANARELLAGADVVVDALDTLPARMILAEAAQDLSLPMVHGAIGGYGGQVMTILPGDPGLRALYGYGAVPERGVETVLGNPAATPMMISAWEVQEVVKLITGRGKLLRNRLLILDAELGEVSEIQLS